MPQVTVYSAIACPFSHRTRMVLEAKGVAYETVEVDLLHAPDWFTAGSPRTQMPRIETDEGAVHGASVVNEYIDERWPQPPLLGEQPAERAEAREWIGWLEEQLQPAYEAALLEIDAERFAELAVVLGQVLRQLESRLEAHRAKPCVADGRFWHGERPGLVDVSYAPTLMRFEGLRRYHAWQLPEGLPRVAEWIDALQAEPIVRDTFHAEEVMRMVGAYLDNFRAQAAARANA